MLPPQLLRAFSRCLRAGQGYYTFILEDYSVFLLEIAPEFGRQENYQFVWRGCRDPQWQLFSSLSRELIHYRCKPGQDWATEVTRKTIHHLLAFIFQLRGVETMQTLHSSLVRSLNRSLLSNPQSLNTVLRVLSDDERMLLLELIALGQHYGLRTPFLDWSSIPATALYFAFNEETPQPEGVGWRVVYALNRTLVERACPPFEDKPDPLTFLDSIAHDNSRLIGQSGGFTFGPPDLPVEKWVVRAFVKDPTAPVLLRFLIRNVRRTNCLNDLDHLNVNARSLFPDRIGACLHSNYNLSK